MSEICVFVGPTRLQSIPHQVDVLAPAALGSVHRAAQAGYRRICLIDGYFGNMPSVWHKEILFALKRGAEVYGCSSMGALRAAELYPFGMVGVGWIYRAFRRGVLQDDDEVCVLHAVAELGFDPLSEAMVNIRYSLRAMRKLGHLNRESEVRIASSLKQLHFGERNSAAIRDAFAHEFGAQGAAKFAHYERTKIDIKSLDADLMLKAVTSATVPAPTDAWMFPLTNHWLQQFVFQNGDLPELCKWHPTTQHKETCATAREVREV